MLLHEQTTGSETHGMVWVQRDFQGHLIPNPFPRAGTAPTRMEEMNGRSRDVLAVHRGKALIPHD